MCTFSFFIIIILHICDFLQKTYFFFLHIALFIQIFISLFSFTVFLFFFYVQVLLTHVLYFLIVVSYIYCLLEFVLGSISHSNSRDLLMRVQIILSEWIWAYLFTEIGFLQFFYNTHFDIRFPIIILKDHKPWTMCESTTKNYDAVAFVHFFSFVLRNFICDLFSNSGKSRFYFVFQNLMKQTNKIEIYRFICMKQKQIKKNICFVT